MKSDGSHLYASVDDIISFKNDFTIPISISLVTAIISIIIYSIDNLPWRELILTTLAFTLAAFLISLHLVIIYKIPKAIIYIFEQKFAKMIDFYALGTDNKTFENSLKLTHEIGNTKVRWMIAKFISCNTLVQNNV
jgi:hypothetical protein